MGSCLPQQAGQNVGTAVDYWNTLHANRFIVTTTKQPSRNGSRVILVLTPELLNEAISEEILGAIPGKTVLGIKLRNCDVEKKILISFIGC